MSRTTLIAILGLLAVILVVWAPSASSEDWPMFLKNTEHNAVVDDSIPDAVEVLWESAAPGGAICTSPVVVDGRVYIGSGGDYNDHLSCYDADTGELVWTVEVADQTHSQWGLVSTPHYEDGRLYILTSDYHAICVDADDGAEVWDTSLISGDLPDIAWTGASAMVSDGLVFCGTDNTNEGDPNLFCLDAGDGSEVWNFESPSGGYFYSTPMVANDRIVVTTYASLTEGEVLCLDAGGNGDGTTDVVWSFSMPGPSFVSGTGQGSQVYVSYGDYRSPSGVFYVYALDIDSRGEMRPLSEDWHYAGTHAFLGSATPYDGKVYIIDMDGIVSCIDAAGAQAKTATADWTRDIGGETWSTPAIADGRMVFGNFNGEVYCLETGTGDEVWTLELTDGDIYSTAAIVDDLIYIGTTDGELFCIGGDTTTPDGGDGGDGTDGTDGTDGGDGSGPASVDGDDGDDGTGDGGDSGDGGDGDDDGGTYKREEDDGDDGSTPGFGAVAVLGVLAVLGVASGLARKRT